MWRQCVRRFSERKVPGALTNWGENLKFEHTHFVAPQNIPELQMAVRNAKKLRVLGSGHSFSGLVESSETLVSLAYMRNVLDFDVDAMQITVEGGTTWGDLVRFLAPRGLATKNIASLPHVTVAGALGTATHGSGLTPGMEAGLPAQCAAVEFVTADGELVRYSRDDADSSKFQHAVVHLGALGVVSRVTLDVVPTYDVQQHVFQQHTVPLQPLLDNYLALARSCDSFTTGINFATDEITLWMRYFETEGGHVAPSPTPQQLLGIPLITADLPFYELGDQQAGVRTTRHGPWHDVPSFFMEGGRERNMPNVALQSEFFVPLEQAPAALAATAALAKTWPGWLHMCKDTAYDIPLVFHCEVRVIPADHLDGLSPFADRDSCSIHFTWGPAKYVGQIAPLIEHLQAVLEPFHARPHWGKLHTKTFTQLNAAFPTDSISRFRRLCAEHDSTGKFMNSHLESILGK